MPEGSTPSAEKTFARKILRRALVLELTPHFREKLERGIKREELVPMIVEQLEELFRLMKTDRLLSEEVEEIAAEIYPLMLQEHGRLRKEKQDER